MTAMHRPTNAVLPPSPHRSAAWWIARQCTAIAFALLLGFLIVVSCALMVEFVRTDLPRIVAGALTDLSHPW
jgi:hypothetical protein